MEPEETPNNIESVSEKSLIQIFLTENEKIKREVNKLRPYSNKNTNSFMWNFKAYNTENDSYFDGNNDESDKDNTYRTSSSKMNQRIKVPHTTKNSENKLPKNTNNNAYNTNNNTYNNTYNNVNNNLYNNTNNNTFNNSNNTNNNQNNLNFDNIITNNEDSEREIILKNPYLSREKKISIKRKLHQKELMDAHEKRVKYLSVKNKGRISLSDVTYNFKQDTNEIINDIKKRKDKYRKSTKYNLSDQDIYHLSASTNKIAKEKKFYVNNSSFLQRPTLSKTFFKNDELRQKKKTGTLRIPKGSILEDFKDPTAFELARNT